MAGWVDKRIDRRVDGWMEGREGRREEKERTLKSAFVRLRTFLFDRCTNVYHKERDLGKEDKSPGQLTLHTGDSRRTPAL